MCQPSAPDARSGHRLEDGADAHAHDHVAWTRRDFLRRMGLASVGAGFVASGMPVGVFAQAPVLDALRHAETDRVLVLVQLSGGNDGLNMVVPVSNDVYYQRRPGLAITPAEALALNAGGGASGWGLHPRMNALVPLWETGKMSVVHAVGYASQNRSHFVSTDNWVTGSGGGTTFVDGWAGRYFLDRLDPGQTAELYRTNPPALTLGGTSRMFDTTDAGNLSIAPLAYTTNITDLVQRGVVYRTDGLPGDQPFAAPIQHLRSTVNVTLSYVVRFVEATSAAQNLAPYPATGNALATQLALAARVIRGGLSPRIITVNIGSFDTHANQATAHATLLGQLGDALRAFFDDLAADGLDRRVIAMTFSEFGRLLAVNGSAGTDHGSAAPAMLFGPALHGGFFGTAPNLVNDLDAGGVRATTDYRSLYATLLERWFEVPPADVDLLLGRAAPRLDLLSGTPTAADPAASPFADALLAPSPNPFLDRATLRVRLARGGNARVDVFDALGRQVAHVFDGALPPGEHALALDGGTFAPGLYLVRLRTDQGVTSRPLVKVR